MKLISIDVPCFNEGACLPSSVARLESVAMSLPEFQFELIFVDDGSSDSTLAFS